MANSFFIEQHDFVFLQGNTVVLQIKIFLHGILTAGIVDLHQIFMSRVASVKETKPMRLPSWKVLMIS